MYSRCRRSMKKFCGWLGGLTGCIIEQRHVVVFGQHSSFIFDTRPSHLSTMIRDNDKGYFASGLLSCITLHYLTLHTCIT